MDCLFCKIATKELATKVVYEDEQLMAFNDISPQAPIHLLIIPKKHISTINHASDEDAPLLGHMILVAKQLASEKGIAETGYRLTFNINEQGGQAVYHIHLHLLGGRNMTWPPG